jgi:CDP-diacylglycerol--glycerol-3-phosphate 3-phosphatidyltransferase
MIEKEISQNNISERFWTIPNVLSIIRIILVVPIVQQMRLNTHTSNLTAFILFIIAFLTDFLDGFLARALKSVSKIGQFIDPMGDKILTITVSALLYFSHKTHFYFFMLILLRDLVISLGALYALNLKKRIVQPLLSGKITTFVLGFVLAIYLLKDSITGVSYEVFVIVQAILDYGTIVSSILLVVSGLNYAINYYRGFLMLANKK